MFATLTTSVPLSTPSEMIFAKAAGVPPSTGPIGAAREGDCGYQLEQFAKDMLRRPFARRRHVNLARIGFGIGNELRNSRGRNRRMHYDRKRCPRDGDYRRNVSNKVEIEIWVECGV